MSHGLRLSNVHKSFEGTKAVAGVSINVVPGEVLALLGPSGCGKSTLLGLVAGLERPDQGEIAWDGQSLQGIPPYKRNFGLMFQDYALFPHMSVFDNIAFGLHMADMSGHQIRTRVMEMMVLVGLAGFERRNVNDLSGGEQQRVALARSLAPAPRLLMLDEPLGSLDRSLRERLVLELGEILHHTQQTSIYVTHDQEEAFSLADRVAVMNAGRLEQIDTPQQIYAFPATPFVARFLGMSNIFPGKVQSDGQAAQVITAIGKFLSPPGSPPQPMVLLRPDAVRLDGLGSVQLTGILTGCSFRGQEYRVTVSVNGLPLQFDFPRNTDLPGIGDRLTLSFDPDTAIQIFPL